MSGGRRDLAVKSGFHAITDNTHFVLHSYILASEIVIVKIVRVLLITDSCSCM